MYIDIYIYIHINISCAALQESPPTLQIRNTTPYTAFDSVREPLHFEARP